MSTQGLELCGVFRHHCNVITILERLAFKIKSKKKQNKTFLCVGRESRTLDNIVFLMDGVLLDQMQNQVN